MNLYEARKKLANGLSIKDMHLKVTTYGRVSTDHEEQKTSLINQKDFFYEMILNNKNWTFVEGYIDDGISGTTDYKRDNFMRMLKDAKNGKFDLILTKEISRFSRNTLDSIKYTRLLLSYGVAVYFYSDNINTIYNDSELRLTIMASMAQDEIRRLSERVKFGMARAQKKGVLLGNNSLYGYNKQSNMLIPIEREAKVVREIFNLYAVEKKSLIKIANFLNDKNIRTRDNNLWTTSTLVRMLKNPKYKGFYCGKKVEVENYITKKVKKIPESKWITYKDCEKISPIVSQKIWNLANSILNEKKKSTSASKCNYSLSHKIFCKEHKKTYRRRKGKVNATWYCSVYLDKGKKFCRSGGVKEKKIKEMVLNKLYENGFNLLNVKKYLLKMYGSFNQISILKKEFVKMKTKIECNKKDLLNLLIEGYITKEMYVAKCKEYDNKILNAKNKIKKISVTNDLSNISFFVDKELSKEYIFDKVIENSIEKVMISNKNNVQILEFVYKDGKKTVSNSINLQS